MLKKQKHEGKFYGAICASPAVVLHTHKLLDGPITAYPAFEKEITNVSYKKETVVITGKCITSQGPATAMEMALKLVELLVDKETATKVAKGLLFT
jgi:4-methyl-5(b-hydroxyethyl)-thiazole monophosphate biosynthesis